MRVITIFTILLLALSCRQVEAVKTAPVKIPAGAKTAVFAAGCFWCAEASFEKVKGVVTVISGYTGGSKKNPSYEEVSEGTTGHTESVQVVYDPKLTTYEKLLDVYWHNVDPTVKDRQFCDVGKQYRSAIFYSSDAEKKAAEKSKQDLLATKKFSKIMTEIVQLKEFYAAEDYHQDFYKKNPTRYQTYKYGCQRSQRLEELWGDSAEH